MAEVRLPSSVAELDAWGEELGLSSQEVRQRFAMGLVLEAIARSNRLRQRLVFKGGNALDFVWLPNRSTLDLDFTSLLPMTLAQMKQVIEGALSAMEKRCGTLLRLQRAEIRPRGPQASFPTIAMTVGYAHRDDAPQRRRMVERDLPSTKTIKVEVSMNDVVSFEATVDFAGRSLRVCTIEDILAEKLRALLQQPVRNRARRQDVLDIAVACTQGLELDYAHIAQALHDKAAARAITVSREAFRNPEVRFRAEQGYAGLEETARRRFIEFDEAWAAVLALVDALALGNGE